MRKIWNKGHRIRASDKHLVYHFSIGTLLFVFVAVLLLLNIKQLMRTDWEHFSLLENGLTLSPLQLHNHTDSDWCLCFSYNCFCYDSFKQFPHRRAHGGWGKISGMKPIMYKTAFFTDSAKRRSKGKKSSGWGNIKTSFLRLEDKLESGLYCELTEARPSCMTAISNIPLLYDMIANRITIDEVRAENGCLRS